MIDVELIRKLVEIMVEYGLSQIRIREGDVFIALRKHQVWDHAVGEERGPLMPVATHGLLPNPAVQTVSAAAEPTTDEGLVPILSPMIGTFYASSECDGEPFVLVGSRVEVDTPVCIIEAMKVFNEINAGVTGVIERILVNNEQSVDYGQPLMMVRPGK